MRNNILLLSTGGGQSCSFKNVDIEYVTFLSPEQVPKECLGKKTYFLKDAPAVKSKYILVACSDAEYPKYYQQLRDWGFAEWEDFIYYPLYGKKICFLNMNCHALPTEYYLSRSPKFMEQYAIYPLMPAKGHSVFYALNEETLSRIDLFLYQNMLPTNPYGPSYADEFTLPRLKKTCRFVSMPNFCPLGGGIFQTQTSAPIRYRGMDAFSQDVLIEEAYENCEIKDVVHLLRYIRNYTKDVGLVKANFQSAWERILNREKRWDIKISDYFIKNYRTTPMVIDISHPSKYLMLEICRRLMAYLNLLDEGKDRETLENEFQRDYFLGTHGFVYPYVRKILDIEYQDEDVRKGFPDYINNAFFHQEKMNHHKDGITLERFIQEYIFVRKGVLLEYRKSEGDISNEQHVINCYRYILGREPENDDVVLQQSNFANLTLLRYKFLRSSEFERIFRTIQDSKDK